MGRSIAIIPAAGRSTRMGGNVKKQYLDIAGKPLLMHTLQVFEDSPLVDGYILVAGSDELDDCCSMIGQTSFVKLLAVVAGGAQRQDSVLCGLSALPGDTDLVIIHDCARPLLAAKDLRAVVAAGKRYGAATLAVPPKDTIKMANDNDCVQKTLPRERLWLIQTPQVFKYEIIMEAYQKAQGTGTKATDDASLVEAIGQRVKLVTGSYSNIKVTTPEDLFFAELMLGQGGASF